MPGHDNSRVRTPFHRGPQGCADERPGIKDALRYSGLPYPSSPRRIPLSPATWLRRRASSSAQGPSSLSCQLSPRRAYKPFEEVWVQAASGDLGTALGAAMYVAHVIGDDARPMPTPALDRSWTEGELAAWLETARVLYERPEDIAEVVAGVLASDGVVAWFQGRSEYGPRALGHRSLLAHPGRPENLERMNDIKGREQFRPIAPMVLKEEATEIFDGPLPSPYMLFTHKVREGWPEKIPAVVHVDGTARIQTVSREAEPLVARVLGAFEKRTGLPVVVNTSLNTAGRPMVDDPRDALECCGSAPVDALDMGPFLVRRPAWGRSAP
ncbi:MAG: hypothetical protein ICV58_08565 [Rubrobacteraceae bacterium]|nr:hypothetical protein [Rubrobacteraceae bacterium]